MQDNIYRIRMQSPMGVKKGTAEIHLQGGRIILELLGGDTNKNVKPGDKMMHIVMIGVNEKLSLVKLKNRINDTNWISTQVFKFN